MVDEREVSSVGRRGVNVPLNLPAKRKGGPIYAIGFLATMLGAALTSAVVAALALSLPEIRRYLKISNM